MERLPCDGHAEQRRDLGRLASLRTKTSDMEESLNTKGNITTYICIGITI